MRITAACFLAALALPAAADEPSLVFGAGATGIWHRNSEVRDTAGIASVEYRSGDRLFRAVKPLVGAFVTSDGSIYAHLGLYGDWHFAPRWSLTPHFSVGAYSHGDKNQLGNSLEFQSGLDLLYRLKGDWRVGATIRHLSNGGTGDTNPGIETLAVLVAIPLR